MSQANDSILVTPGSGATVATHNPGDGKEYQVVMVAGDGGHIHGTKPSYLMMVPPQAVAASKNYFDLFNAAGSGKVMEINGIWAIPKTDVAIVGVVGVELQTARTNTVGTGGTGHAYNGTSFAALNISPKDTGNAALPAQVTARFTPTGGAAIQSALFGSYIFTEETNAGANLAQFFNLLPASTTELQSLTFREGFGLRVSQGTVAGLGSIGFLIDFTLI